MRPKLPNFVPEPKFIRTLVVLLAIHALSALPAVSGQILERASSRENTMQLESPTAYSTNKERALIREVLEPELLMRLEPGQSKIIRTNYPVIRTAISHDDIVDVQAFDSNELEVIGKAEGDSTLTFWFEVPNGSVHVLRYAVEVDNEREKERKRIAHFKQLESKINELFPNSQVFLIPIDDKIVVRGQARDSKEAFEIMQLLGRSNGSRQPNSAGITGSISGLLGLDPADANSASQDDDDSLANLNFINLLRVPGEQQVMLKVRIAELNRTANRSKGANLSTIFDGNELSNLISGGSNLTAILNDGDVRFLLRAISSHGYGKILAEPTLVTISGKPARFLAGGEFAVPTTVGIDGVGAVSTTFYGFGTELSFTPTITDKDMIRLEVAPSFSTLNPDATVGGIPGLSRRSVETTVDLREGQWLAIAGLIQDEQGGQRTKLPFAGEMPVLGGLFGSQDVTRSETELVVLVSPQLIHPLESYQLPPLLPGGSIMDPTDDDFFLRHQTQGYQGYEHRSTVWPERSAQMGGFRREEILNGIRPRILNRIRSQSAYISGNSGFSESP